MKRVSRRSGTGKGEDTAQPQVSFVLFFKYTHALSLAPKKKKLLENTFTNK